MQTHIVCTTLVKMLAFFGNFISSCVMHFYQESLWWMKFIFNANTSATGVTLI